MPLWMMLVTAVVICVLLLVALLVAIVARRRWITRQGVTCELSVNTGTEHSAKGWMLGFAVYASAELRWFRTFSLSLRPRYVFVRGTVLIDRRRDPEGAESYALHDGHVIVETKNATPVKQLALDPDYLTALLAWLESSPPGLDVDKVL